MPKIDVSGLTALFQPVFASSATVEQGSGDEEEYVWHGVRVEGEGPYFVVGAPKKTGATWGKNEGS